MARSFTELEERMSPESITRSNAMYERLKEDMALHELRDSGRVEADD
jgi:hypothetical protein